MFRSTFCVALLQILVNSAKVSTVCEPPTKVEAPKVDIQSVTLGEAKEIIWPVFTVYPTDCVLTYKVDVMTVLADYVTVDTATRSLKVNMGTAVKLDWTKKHWVDVYPLTPKGAEISGASPLQVFLQFTGETIPVEKTPQQESTDKFNKVIETIIEVGTAGVAAAKIVDSMG